MAASDLQLTAGTTFAFGVTWQTKDGDQMVAVDLSGCTARLQMRDVKSGALLVAAEIGDGIEITDPKAGEISVSLKPAKTRELGPSPLGALIYELRVYFPSGDAYPVMTGFVAVAEGVIRD